MGLPTSSFIGGTFPLASAIRGAQVEKLRLERIAMPGSQSPKMLRGNPASDMRSIRARRQVVSDLGRMEPYPPGRFGQFE